MSLDLLFKSPEWMKIKTGTIKTDRVLTKIEFLKEIGWKDFTEEKYREYLKSMNVENRELVYDEREEIF